MKTILELLPFLNFQAGLIGLEIEVEGNDLPNVNNTTRTFREVWQITQDGSLRGEAWEYVFRKPLTLEDTKKALALLQKQYENCGSTVHDSVRAGIHAHINVQDLTVKQLVTFATIYYSLEEVLTNFCGEDRAGNHFCLRACDAEYMIYALHQAFKQGRFGELCSDVVRYSAMNVTSLFKYGSIEFRALRSTNDMERIMVWASTLARLKDCAKEFDSPRAVVESMSMDGAEPFAKRVLGEFFPYFACEGLEQKVMHGARSVQELAFLVDVDGMNGFRYDLLPQPPKLAAAHRPQDVFGGLEAPLPEPGMEVAGDPFNQPVRALNRGADGRFLKPAPAGWGEPRLQPAANIQWEPVAAAPQWFFNEANRVEVEDDVPEPDFDDHFDRDFLDRAGEEDED
jgi:hypothetical protein